MPLLQSVVPPTISVTGPQYNNTPILPVIYSALILRLYTYITLVLTYIYYCNSVDFHFLDNRIFFSTFPVSITRIDIFYNIISIYHYVSRRPAGSSPSSTIRGQHHQHPEHEHQHQTFDDSWAWYVVGGCAFANFLLPGMLRSFGPDVLDGFVEVHKLEFENRSVVGCRWIPATFHLTFFIAGTCQKR